MDSLWEDFLQLCLLHNFACDQSGPYILISVGSSFHLYCFLKQTAWLPLCPASLWISNPGRKQICMVGLKWPSGHPHPSQVYSALKCRQLSMGSTGMCEFLAHASHIWPSMFAALSSAGYSLPSSFLWSLLRTRRLSELKWTCCNVSPKEISC